MKRENEVRFGFFWKEGGSEVGIFVIECFLKEIGRLLSFSSPFFRSILAGEISVYHMVSSFAFPAQLLAVCKISWSQNGTEREWDRGGRMTNEKGEIKAKEYSQLVGLWGILICKSMLPAAKHIWWILVWHSSPKFENLKSITKIKALRLWLLWHTELKLNNQEFHR